MPPRRSSARSSNASSRCPVAARPFGENFRFIELANDINGHMPHYVVRRVTAALNERRKAVNGSRIVVLGISYKPNVGDTRETPARPIIEQLAGLGADLTVVDPFAAATSESFAGLPLHAEATAEDLAGCDLVILLTDHDSFNYDEVARLSTHVLDTRTRIARDAGSIERL